MPSMLLFSARVAVPSSGKNFVDFDVGTVAAYCSLLDAWQSQIDKTKLFTKIEATEPF